MADGKHRILVVAELERVTYSAIVNILRESSEVREWYIVKNIHFPPSLMKRWKDVFIGIREIMKEFNPHKIIICGGSLISVWLVVFLTRISRKKIEIIFYKNDIENFRLYPSGFRAKIGHFIARATERYCMLAADKIIHKGLYKELEYLAFYSSIKSKPHYLFREFLEEKNLVPYSTNGKLSSKDKEIHLAYVGGFYIENRSYHDSILGFCDTVTKHKIHLHIYSEQSSAVEQKLRKLSNQNKFFHYEGFVSHDKLMNKISQYDYGIFGLHRGDRKMEGDRQFIITAFGFKIFDYISAHLPVICTRDLTAAVEFLEKYNIGLIIDNEEIHKIKIILDNNRKNYLKMIKNIDRAIPHLLNRTDFIDFIIR